MTPRHKTEEPFWTLRFPKLCSLHLFGWGCKLFAEPESRRRFFEEHVGTLNAIRLDDYEGYGPLELAFAMKKLNYKDSEQLAITYLNTSPALIQHQFEHYERYLRSSLEKVVIMSEWEEEALRTMTIAQLNSVLQRISSTVAILPLGRLEFVKIRFPRPHSFSAHAGTLVEAEAGEGEELTLQCFREICERLTGYSPDVWTGSLASVLGLCGESWDGREEDRFANLKVGGAGDMQEGGSGSRY